MHTLIFEAGRKAVEFFYENCSCENAEASVGDCKIRSENELKTRGCERFTYPLSKSCEGMGKVTKNVKMADNSLDNLPDIW